jgi:hypothetical protein
MHEYVTCPVCGIGKQTMDHLVDHVTDDHGWAPAAALDEGAV